MQQRVGAYCTDIHAQVRYLLRLAAHGVGISGLAQQAPSSDNIGVSCQREGEERAARRRGGSRLIKRLRLVGKGGRSLFPTSSGHLRRAG